MALAGDMWVFVDVTNSKITVELPYSSGAWCCGLQR